MSKKKDVHVVPNSNGGWDVKREGADRASNHYNTKAEADKRGRELAKGDDVEYIPHLKNGQIQNPDSYGNDPNPPKDKN